MRLAAHSPTTADRAMTPPPSGPKAILGLLLTGTVWRDERLAPIAYTDQVPQMTINTLIVDDEKPAREELAFLLKSFPDIQLVAQGKNGLEAVNLIKEHSPDLVFLDVQMPGLDGFGVIKKLLDKRVPLPKIVF